MAEITAIQRSQLYQPASRYSNEVQLCKMSRYESKRMPAVSVETNFSAKIEMVRYFFTVSRVFSIYATRDLFLKDW